MNDRFSEVSVLLVDDDSIDRMAVVRAFRELQIANPVIEANDGIEALEILRGGHDAEPLATPFLVLLDLSMPRMDGLEFLAELRNDPALHTAIVFILSTSKADEDRTAAYENHVAGYIVKADFASEFWRVVDMIDHYWRVVAFP